MIRNVEAVVDAQGRVKLSESVRVPAPRTFGRLNSSCSISILGFIAV